MDIFPHARTHWPLTAYCFGFDIRALLRGLHLSISYLVNWEPCWIEGQNLLDPSGGSRERRQMCPSAWSKYERVIEHLSPPRVKKGVPLEEPIYYFGWPSLKAMLINGPRHFDVS
jgi:hypothetical protein